MIDPKVLLYAANLEKSYQLGRSHEPVKALRGLSLTICRGEFVALSGSSGSGKTSLLNILGGLDSPTAGLISIAGHELHRMSDTEISRFRAEKLGFIFQTFNLQPVLSAVENVEYSLRKTFLSRKETRARALDALTEVGLGKFAHHRPDQLSGGQRQRVAIARAVVHRPELILADEPTGNLDRETTAEILDLLSEMQRGLGLTLVVATHDPAVMKRADRVLHIKNGQVYSAVKEAFQHNIYATRAV